MYNGKSLFMPRQLIKSPSCFGASGESFEEEQKDTFALRKKKDGNIGGDGIYLFIGSKLCVRRATCCMFGIITGEEKVEE